MSNETEVSADVLAKATEMGWVDKADFKGDPEKWITASEFVDRGEHLLPILHATNRRLKDDVSSLKGQVTSMTQALREAQETMAALETYHDEEVKRKVTAARENLKVELAEASRSGDHVAIADLTSKITELNTEEAADSKRREEEEKARKAALSRPTDYTKDPNFIAWKEANPWYGTDMVRTSIANMLSWKLRDSNYEGSTTVTGRAYLDKITEGVEAEIRKLTGGQSRRDSKVEAGGVRDDRKGIGGKTYADLPPEAKTACDAFEKQLVGPNKPYKTLADWRKKYAERHFT